MPVFGYCRVSLVKQAEEGESLARISHTELGDCTWRGKPMLIEEVSQCP
jgi:hypothetical protein